MKPILIKYSTENLKKYGHPLSEVPNTIFKYKPIDEWSLNILKKREIYFSRPEQFNDPFDCGIPLRFDLMKENDYEEHMISIGMHQFHLTRSESIEFIASNRKKGIGVTFEQYKSHSDQQLRKLQNAVRIFCLTTNTKNLLMWSHYADFHRGMCIGFNKHYLYLNTGNAIGKVNYFATLPVQKPQESGIPTYIVQFLSKSICWQYEEEFRMVTMDGEQVHQLEPKAIEQILVGCKVSSDNLSAIKDTIRSDKELHHVKLFQAKMVKYQFELRFEEIELN